MKPTSKIQAATAAVAAVLQRHPEAALERTEAALAAVEADITNLLAERDKMLVDTDDVATIAEIDQRLDQRRRAVQIHRERVQVLRGQVLDLQHRQRIAARDKAVQEITARLAARKHAAVKLDRAIEAVAAAIAELDAADRNAFKDWPLDLLPSPRLFGFLRMNLEPLSTVRKARPLSPGCVRAMIEKAPFDFTTEAENRNCELAAELAGAPLPDHVAAA